MTLNELGDQYLQTAKLLEEGLGELRLRLRTARGDEALELKKRADLMREEWSDAVTIARVLHDYYS